MSNIVNPFASQLPTVGISSPYAKPVGIVQDSPIIPLPYAPAGGYSASFGANLALAVTGLNLTMGLSNSNNILTFNTQEVAALQNTYTILHTISTNGQTSPFTFTQTQLQDMFVSVIAVNNSQNSGAYITLPDLANNGIGLQDANTGWFPETALTLVCNDQYMLAELPGSGNWYWSNTANAADWSVLNSADMEVYSDQPIAMDEYLGSTVVAFGVQSIQFFTDTGLPSPSTYQNVPGTSQAYGLAAIFSRAQFMNSIAFLGQNKTGQVHVFMFQGYTPTIISTPDIDQIINSFQVVNDAMAFAYDNNGHQFYQLTFPTAGRSFLYDGTTQIWSEVQSGTYSDYGRHLAGQAVTFNTTTLIGDCSTGNVYISDSTNPTDAGFLVRREATSKHINVGGDRFTVAQLWLEVNTGQYATIPGLTNLVANSQFFTNTFTFIAGQPAGNANNVPLGFSDGSIESPSFGQAYSYPLPTLIPSASYQVLSLLNFEDGNNSTAFTDSANTGVVWTANAAAKESNTQIKYGTGSGAFLAANGHDYIFANAAVGTTLDLVTGQPDWTVESWVYPAGTSGVTQYLWDLSDRGNTLFQLYYNGTSMSASFPSIGMAASGQCVPNTWNHVAVTRNGNNGYLFINGKFPGPAGVTNDIAAGALPALSANAQYTLGALINSFGNPSGGAVAYIDDFRITKGRAIYAGNFTPPPQSLTTSVNFPYIVSTLLHFDDGANTFIDSAVVPNIYTAGGSNGTVSESSTQAKYGTGSLFSSGLDAHLTTSIANNAGPMDLTEATYAQDFTVEYFVYPTSNANAQYHLDLSGNNKTLFQTFMGNTGTINVALTALTGINSGATKISTNTWHHVAVEKKGLKYRLYVDGVNDSANGVSADIVPNQSNTANVMYVGSAWNSNTFLNGLKNGYLDELRIIKGQALYTANFAVPNTAFTTLGNPVLPNIGKIVVWQDGLTGNVAQNLRMSVATGSNVVVGPNGSNVIVTTVSNVSFLDAQGNTQLYLTPPTSLTQNTSNNPVDTTWLWSPSQTYPAWNANTTYLVTVNTSQTQYNYYPPPPATTPQILMYWSTDNGNTWKGPRSASLGAVGQYSKRVVWRKVCNARDVVFKFVVTDPVPLTIVRGMAVVVPGTG